MNQPHTTSIRMSVREALQVLVDVRDESMAVITNQGSSRVWPLLAQHRLDFHYNPSTMGGAVPLGLGIALACPSKHIVVISGDGALTMSLGSLVSVAAAACANLTVVVLDNGLYEVTGGQRTASSLTQVDYVALAQSVGFPSAFEFDTEPHWRDRATSVLGADGPRLISLRVDRTQPGDLSTPAGDMAAQLARLRAAL